MLKFKKWKNFYLSIKTEGNNDSAQYDSVAANLDLDAWRGEIWVRLLPQGKGGRWNKK